MTNQSILVVGGGLAGLLAANLAVAQAPTARVTLIERGVVGGRARSIEQHGFAVNQGPHALYLEGALAQALASLGVTPAGAPPVLKGSLGMIGGEIGLLPQGPMSMASTSLLSWRDKVAVVKFLAGLGRLRPAEFADQTVDEWIADCTTRPKVASLLRGLVNLVTYSAAHDQLSADAAIANLQIGIDPGVVYLDEGWQQLVDKLDQRLPADRCVRVKATVTGVRSSAAGVTVATTEGDHQGNAAIIAAGSPAIADGLLGLADTPESLVVQAGPPVRAAVLDLGLSKAPTSSLLLGLDSRLYASVHADQAVVSTESPTLLTVARYLRDDDAHDAATSEQALFAHATRLGVTAPDVVYRRYSHSMPVAWGMPMAPAGLAGRPARVPLDNVYLAGDWVGPTGLLADAAAASAVRAVEAILG